MIVGFVSPVKIILWKPNSYSGNFAVNLSSPNSNSLFFFYLTEYIKDELVSISNESLIISKLRSLGFSYINKNRKLTKKFVDYAMGINL
mgnify:CR=1 FL=1